MPADKYALIVSAWRHLIGIDDWHIHLIIMARAWAYVMLTNNSRRCYGGFGVGGVAVLLPPHIDFVWPIETIEGL